MSVFSTKVRKMAINLFQQFIITVITTQNHRSAIMLVIYWHPLWLRLLSLSRIFDCQKVLLSGFLLSFLWKGFLTQTLHLLVNFFKKSCFSVVMIDCSLLILLSLLIIYLGVTNSVISEDDLTFGFISKMNLWDLQPQSSKLPVVSAGRLERDADVCKLMYFEGCYLSFGILDYGDLNEILFDCMLVIDFVLVVVSLRFWKAFFWAFRWILINFLTLPSFDSIFIQIILFSIILLSKSNAAKTNLTGLIFNSNDILTIIFICYVFDTSSYQICSQGIHGKLQTKNINGLVVIIVCNVL